MAVMAGGLFLVEKIVMQASPETQVKRFAWTRRRRTAAHDIYENQTAQFPLSFTLVVRKLD